MQREEGDTEKKKKKQKKTKTTHKKCSACCCVLINPFKCFSASLLFCLFFVSTHVASLLLFLLLKLELCSTLATATTSQMKLKADTQKSSNLLNFGLGLARSAQRSSAQLGSAVDADVDVCVSAGSTSSTQFVCSRSVFSFGILRA